MRVLLFGFWARIGQPTRQGNGSDRNAYVNQLLAAFPTVQPVNKTDAPIARPLTQELIEPLSERELEILRLVATGFSNSQLAEKLIVTVGTIKKHLNNIYGKLGVASRTQAIARGRELGLLAD